MQIRNAVSMRLCVVGVLAVSMTASACGVAEQGKKQKTRLEQMDIEGIKARLLATAKSPIAWAAAICIVWAGPEKFIHGHPLLSILGLGLYLTYLKGDFEAGRERHQGEIRAQISVTAESGKREAQPAG